MVHVQRLHVAGLAPLTSAIRKTAELRRILALPRREPRDLEALAQEMTELLKTPQGTMSLRTSQALALLDIAEHRGALLPISVGDGKTIIFALTSYVLEAKRPIGLLPAGLIEKTQRELRHLSRHWLIPNNLRLLSYEMLGREQAANELEEYKPDAIVGDEIHRLKNLNAACTRRVARYMAAHPETAFVGMSGTIMRDSIYDFAPLLFWALKGQAPLPLVGHELEEWAQALEEPKGNRYGETIEPPSPGALLELCSVEELKEQPLTAARLGFRRRLTETPGVVTTEGAGEHVGASIRVTGHVYEMSSITEGHFSKLRNAMLRPDNFELMTGVEVWQHAKELALGFHSSWVPDPPREWLDPRKAWNAFVRAFLLRSRTLDSPEQVEKAVLEGRVDDRGLLAAWHAVKDSYVHDVVSTWHDDTVLKIAKRWAKKPGIVWAEHVFFAERLAQETGLPYYGAQGLDATGCYIEDSTSKTIIASLDANKDGKNLQHKWDRNLFVGPPDGWDAFQQAVARTHRPLQKSDEVIVDVLLGCREHLSAWKRIVSGTQAAKDMIGGMPKLLLADVVGFPTEEESKNFLGDRW